MKNLSRWTGDPHRLFDEIAATASIHGPNLFAARPAIVSEYSWYARTRPFLEKAVPRPASKSHRASLLAVYDNAPVPLQRMKQAIRKRQFDRKCPYCGIDTAHEWDHYIPKKKFPQFAIYPHNLVPCCGTCNRDRGNRWLENSRRTTLHFYFDQITKNKMLSVRLSFFARGRFVASYQLTPPSLPTKADDAFCKHVESLKLIARFNEAATDRIKGLISDLHGEPQAYSANKLKKMSHAAARKWGENHWEAALFEALSKSKKFRAWAGAQLGGSN